MTVTEELRRLERADFEAWALKAGADITRQNTNAHHWMGDYKHSITQAAWAGWLARAGM